MSDSFTEKLYRLKSTCEERVDRIEAIKNEIEVEKAQIDFLMNSKPTDLVMASVKHNVVTLQLQLGTIYFVYFVISLWLKYLHLYYLQKRHAKQ